MSTTQPNIRNLLYLENDVGKTWKATKKHYVWEFELNQKHHKIEMYDSKLTGKKKVIKDGRVIFEDENTFEITFSHAFTIDDAPCTLIQYGDNYELRINNNSFGYLMDLEKNQIFFGNDSKKDPTSTTFTNTNVRAQGNNLKMNQGKEKEKQKSEFNFAIKPVNAVQNNNPTEFKRFGNAPGVNPNKIHSNVNIKKENKVEEEKPNNILIDFNTENIQSSVNDKPKSNTNNLFDFGDVDFTNNNTNTQNALVAVGNNQTHQDNLINDQFGFNNTNQSSTNVSQPCLPSATTKDVKVNPLDNIYSLYDEKDKGLPQTNPYGNQGFNQNPYFNQPQIGFQQGYQPGFQQGFQPGYQQSYQPGFQQQNQGFGNPNVNFSNNNQFSQFPQQGIQQPHNQSVNFNDINFQSGINQSSNNQSGFNVGNTKKNDPLDSFFG